MPTALLLLDASPSIPILAYSPRTAEKTCLILRTPISTRRDRSADLRGLLVKIVRLGIQLLRGSIRRRSKGVGGRRLLILKCMEVGYINEMNGNYIDMMLELVSHWWLTMQIFR